MKTTISLKKISFTGWYTPAEKYQRSSVTNPRPASFEITEITDNDGNNITESVDEIIDLMKIDPVKLEEALINYIDNFVNNY